MTEDLYQEFIIELYKHPLNFGKLSGATHRASVDNSTCGDSIELFLTVKAGKISDAKFIGSGCAISQASASLFTQYLKGKRLVEARKLGKEVVLGLLKVDLSKNPSRMKCALLPLDALRKALAV